MKRYAVELKRGFADQLADAAFAYLDTGLSIFYDIAYHSEPASPQVALGNIAIAVELMLKTFIAQKNLLLLFKELSAEAKTFLLCSDNLPPNFNWRVYDLELKSATKKVIDFGECEAILFLFFPGLKQPLKTHLDSLVAVRNSCVHSILPPFQKYELERAAYVALQVLHTLGKAGALPAGHYRDVENDATFLKSFQEAKLRLVQEKLEKAKENAKRLTEGKKTIEIEPLIAQNPVLYWLKLVIDCPICGNGALLGGFTETLTTEESQDGPAEEFLGFLPDQFQCDSCGLKLDDYSELMSAGIESMYPRDDDVEAYNRDLEALGAQTDGHEQA